LGREDVENFLKNNPGKWSCPEICKKIGYGQSGVSRILKIISELSYIGSEYVVVRVYRNAARPVKKYWWKKDGKSRD